MILVITGIENQTYLYTRKGHCVFLQRFLSGSLRAFQWEGARDVKIAANHWHTTALPTYLRWHTTAQPTYLPTCGENIQTFWQTRSHSANFYICCQHLSEWHGCYPGREFAFFSPAGTFGRGAAPFLGQLAHFMNHNTLYRPPPLHCCQPIFRGCACAVGGCGARDENKNFVRAMAVLTPWHWLVDCTYPLFLCFALP